MAVVVTPSSVGASVSTLHHRAHRQQAHLHAVVGTVRFFTNHPKQARTMVGRRETRRARVWITVLKRELAETVAALRPRPQSVPTNGPFPIDSCTATILSHEGGMDPHKWNSSGSGAYGGPQALPGSKMASAGSDWRDNIWTQIRWMVGYERQRYGSPCAALAAWNRQGWY